MTNNQGDTMTTKIKCAICGDEGFEDGVMYALNPLTFRMATMHVDCFAGPYDDLQYQKPSDSVKFKNRLDEYEQKIV